MESHLHTVTVEDLRNVRRRAKERQHDGKEAAQSFKEPPAIPTRTSSLRSVSSHKKRHTTSISSSRNTHSSGLVMTLDGTIAWSDPDPESVKSLFRHTLRMAHERKFIDEERNGKAEYQSLSRSARREFNKSRQPSNTASARREVHPRSCQDESSSFDIEDENTPHRSSLDSEPQPAFHPPQQPSSHAPSTSNTPNTFPPSHTSIDALIHDLSTTSLDNEISALPKVAVRPPTPGRAERFFDHTVRHLGKSVGLKYKLPSSQRKIEETQQRQ